MRCFVAPLLSALALGASCAPAPTARPPAPAVSAEPPASASAAPPPTPLPALRFGALVASQRAQRLELPVRRYYRGAGFEVLGLALPLSQQEVRQVHSVRLTASGLATTTTGGLFSSSADGEASTGPLLWALLPKGPSVSGNLLRAREGAAGEIIPFKGVGALPRSDRRALLEVADRYRNVNSAYHQFVAERVLSAFGNAPRADREQREQQASDWLLQTMLDERAGSVIEQTRFREASAFRDSAGQRAPLQSLEAVERLRFPFEQWLSEQAEASPAEPLAAHAPQDFYYLRARTPRSLLALLDDEGVLSAARSLGLAEPLVRDLSAQYLDQLGLSRELLGKLAAGVVGEVAIVGSDLAFSRGADVSLLFELKDEVAFVAALDAELATRSSATVSDFSLSTALASGAVAVPLRATEHRLAGRSSQWRLFSKNFAAISNSPKALLHLAQVSAGTAPALKSDAAFRYLRSKTNGAPTDALAFIGDAFIDVHDGPARRVQSVRARLAHAELKTVGFAALLYSEMMGRPPSTVRELTGLGLLLESELKHSDGQRITLTPEGIPTSAWGNNARLTPLLDQPAPLRVSRREQDAYAAYKQRREFGEASFRGPLLVGIDLKLRESTVFGFKVHLHTVPVAPEYALFAANTQQMGAVQPTPSPGARLFAVLPPSDLPEPLRAILNVPPGATLSDLGRSFTLNLNDDAQLAHAVRATFGAPELPTGEATARPQERGVAPLLAALNGIPLDLRLELGSGAEDGKAPSKLEEVLLNLGFTAHRDAPSAGPILTRWTLNPTPMCSDARCLFQLYTAQQGTQLLISSRRENLLELLAKPALAASPAPSGPVSQLAYQWSAATDGALEMVLSWFFEAHRRRAEESSRELASVLFMADPETRKNGYVKLAQRWLGAVPTTPEGNVFEWVEDGVNDPLRGTLASPSWPELPLSDSRSVALTRLLNHVDLRVTFTREGSVDGSPVHGVIFDLSAGEP
jgi:hypothetical protein